MEKNRTKTESLWTAIKLFFENDVENTPEFQEDLENIEKIQARIHNEIENYGASLVVMQKEKNKENKELSKSVSKSKKVEKDKKDEREK